MSLLNENKAYLKLYVLCLTIFLLALSARIAFVVKTRNPLVQSEIENIAVNLAEYRAFANPYVVPTGWTAHTAPAFPFLLSLVYEFTGTNPVRYFAASSLGCFASALTFSLLPWLAVKLRMHRSSGVVAGLIGAVTPLFFWIETQPSDAPWIALCLVVSLGYVAQLRDQQPFGWAICGTVIGTSFLFGPALLPVLGVVLILTACHPDHQIYKRWATLGLVAAAIVAPWIIRNYIRLGSVFWLRDNFGLELYYGNNENARAWMDDNKIASAKIHPFGNREEAIKIRELGEVRCFKDDFILARHWIMEHPNRFTRLTLERIRLFWIPPLNRAAKTWALGLLTVAGLVGLLLLRRENEDAFRYLISVWATYPFVYYIVAADPRYRYPLYPIILLSVGYLGERALSRFSRLRILSDESVPLLSS